jgi:chromosome segregation ATPase
MTTAEWITVAVTVIGGGGLVGWLQASFSKLKSIDLTLAEVGYEIRLLRAELGALREGSSDARRRSEQEHATIWSQIGDIQKHLSNAQDKLARVETKVFSTGEP